MFSFCYKSFSLLYFSGLGQLLAFDNLRCLHGRTGFGIDMKGERHVQGAYVDWDEARSRIRVLKAKLTAEK